MPLEIELLPRGWPHRVPSMPKNLEKVQIYPKPVKWATLFRANPVIILLHMHYLFYCQWTILLLIQWTEHTSNWNQYHVKQTASVRQHRFHNQWKNRSLLCILWKYKHLLCRYLYQSPWSKQSMDRALGALLLTFRRRANYEIKVLLKLFSNLPQKDFL